VRCAATILLLDLLNYAAHRTFHSVSFLWRVHEVHHSDPDYDVSTAARFHPIEVVGVQGAHLAVIALLAPPALAVFIAGLLTEVLNLFVHANASLPGWVERWLRIVFITPDLHRIHHSEDIGEQQRNLGQTFAFWDRLFGTFQQDEPRAGEITTGLKGFQNAESFGLGFMLMGPFQSRPQPQPDPVSGD
jgi:sterol desaturase/sphingolipid hydroxylase (fatty acid hydroxylase superfamily)